MRGTLSILVLAVAIAAGLWYVLERPETPIEPRQADPTEPISDAAPAAGDSQTADSAPSTDAAQSADSDTASSAGNLQSTDPGTAAPTDTAQTTDSGAAAQGEEPGTADSSTAVPTGVAQTTGSGAAAQGEEPETADSGTAVRTGVAQTTDSGTAAQGEESQTADSGTTVPTGVAPTTDSGAAAQGEEHRTADSGTTVPTGVAPTTDSGAAAAAGKAQTAEIDTATPTDAIQSTDSGATEATPQIAAVGEADRSGTQALVLSPAPEDTIEQVPVDAPPATDTAGETGILATVDRVIEQIETAIREQLATEPEGDPDTQLRVQVTYGDSQGDATQPGGEPSEPDRPTDSDTKTLSDAGQTTDSAATLPAGDAPTAESGVIAPAGITQSAESGVIAPADVAQSADSGVIAPADIAQSADSGVIAPAGITQSAESGVIAPADITQSAESDDTPPPEVTRTADSDAAEAEAKEYVEALTETAPQTIPVDKADHFVTQEHVLSLVPEDTIERVSVDELAKDESLKPETPITIVREVEQIETAVPERLIAESGGDLDTQLRVLVKYDDTEGVTEPGVTEPSVPAPSVAEPSVTAPSVPAPSVTEPSVTEPSVTEPSVTEPSVAEPSVAEPSVAEPSEPSVTEPSVADQGDAEPSVAAQGDVEPGNVGQTVAQQDTVEQITVREALKRILAEPEKPISLIKTVRYFEVVTLRELLDTGVDTDTFLNVVRRPYRLEAATLADLLRRKKAENPDTIFYLHTVQPTDEQGIWGIVQYGIIDNFARGVALERGEKMETYTVQIPRHADERLDDQSSSYLGKLIDHKTKDSYVYNYRDHRMGRNPDRIYPGQELVIINFEPEELTAIYTHFASG